MKTVISFCMLLKKRFTVHDVAPRSAQMTYYWILAIFPFLMMIISWLMYANIDWSFMMEYVADVVPDMVEPFPSSQQEPLAEFCSRY